MVVAAWPSQVGNRQPYLSAEDARQSPVLSAFDLTTLIPGGDPTVQDTALRELIRAASSKIDDYVVGEFGTLGAVESVFETRVNVQPDGSLILTPEFGPLLKVVSAKVGATPATLLDVTLSPTSVVVQRWRAFVYPWSASSGIAVGSLDFALGLVPANRGRLWYCQLTYLNGWPHGFSTNDVDAGAAHLPSLDSTLGWLPGAQGFIYDGALTEPFQVSPSWDETTLPIAVTGTLRYNHGTGVMVSSLPETVRQATLHFVADKLEERGEEGITLQGSGFVPNPSGGGGKAHSSEAYDLLDAFRQAWQVPS